MWVLTTRHSRKNRENGSIPRFYFIKRRKPSIVSLPEDKVAQTPTSAIQTDSIFILTSYLIFSL